MIQNGVKVWYSGHRPLRKPWSMNSKSISSLPSFYLFAKTSRFRFYPLAKTLFGSTFYILAKTLSLHAIFRLKCEDHFIVCLKRLIYILYFKCLDLHGWPVSWRLPSRSCALGRVCRCDQTCRSNSSKQTKMKSKLSLERKKPIMTCLILVSQEFVGLQWTYHWHLWILPFLLHRKGVLLILIKVP